MQTISATDLARNTREILDIVVSQGVTVAIERNRTMIAQIMPPQRTMTAAQALAGLTFPMLTAAQGAAWLKDSRTSFGDTVHDPSNTATFEWQVGEIRAALKEVNAGDYASEQDVANLAMKWKAREN